MVLMVYVHLYAGFELIYEGEEQEFLCDHLMPGQTYRLRVACCSKGGRSEVGIIISQVLAMYLCASAPHKRYS